MARIDDLCINTIKMLSVDVVEKAKSGHPGMPLGDAAMAYALWSRALAHNPKNPLWPNRDRFVLSAGHGSALLYSLLHLTGYDLTLDDLKNFRQWGSHTPGHPEYAPFRGIETTTGPLGQGFATGVGMALAERRLRDLFNRPGFPIFDYNIYGILGDGDMMEGVTSEAASLAGHLGLGKIIYLYSDNRITIEGPTDIAFTEDVGRRYEAYGWHVQRVDGYDMAGIERALKSAKKEKGRPSLIIARTCIARGCPNLEGTSKAHGAPIGGDEARLLRKSCSWPDRSFYIPREVSSRMRKAVPAGRKLEAEWQSMLAGYGKKYPALGKTLEDFTAGRFLEGWEKAMPVFKPGDSIATRSASGKVLNALAPKIPQLIGGSADLAPSNNTYIKDGGDFTPERSGRNVHFGVREHAMGAVLNGIALSNLLIPYGGTFLVFADYLRPALRLSSLMRTHAIYVFTHDSIGVGEDGPTHQPVEHMASQRAMPGLTVIRPADANETAEAWKLALSQTGPTSLILSRQNLPVLDRRKNGYGPASGILKGAYILSDSVGAPDLILIGSGSEVHLCLEAAKILREKNGLAVRVVNMASWRLFDIQPQRYRDKVLPPGVEARLSVEAASTMGWKKYTGLRGAEIGLDRFGASAPGKTVFEKFGFTVDNVVRTALRLVKGRAVKNKNQNQNQKSKTSKTEIS
ncbi:MAG: transketolase [Nitrospiraceae bacterium]|nr:transketolase [Nitrospiraceae bacterium]